MAREQNLLFDHRNGIDRWPLNKRFHSVGRSLGQLGISKADSFYPRCGAVYNVGFEIG